MKKYTFKNGIMVRKNSIAGYTVTAYRAIKGTSYITLPIIAIAIAGVIFKIFGI